MTGQFEQEVTAALQVFLGAITRAAERAAIEAIRSAFVRVSLQSSHAVSISGDDEHRSMSSRIGRASTPIDLAAVREQVAACLRENPGWNSAQLARHLGVHTSKLRRHLRILAHDGAIRFEERPVGFGGQLRRAYFVVEHTNGERADDPAVPAEATA